MYTNILLPTDGSPLSRKAIANGIRLARTVGARVTGFYSAPPPTPIEFKGFLPVGYVNPEKHRQTIKRAAEQHLSVIQRAAAAAGVPCKTAFVTNDYAAEAIVAAAKRYRCDLIFMSSHGRRGFRDSMLGTHTQKVLTLSPVPVLVDR
ncbi:MAG: universal stress protein [Burkholderiales bacterium]|nr:universal stress protein [Burkholderiales bacterium]